MDYGTKDPRAKGGTGSAEGLQLQCVTKPMLEYRRPKPRSATNNARSLQEQSPPAYLTHISDDLVSTTGSGERTTNEALLQGSQKATP